jgi:hypothetical protein
MWDLQGYKDDLSLSSLSSGSYFVRFHRKKIYARKPITPSTAWITIAFFSFGKNKRNKLKLQILKYFEI